MSSAAVAVVAAPAASIAGVVASVAIDSRKIAQAARLIQAADAVLVCTGAGMGVASGYGTFRGASAGVWPPLLKHSPPIPFQAMSCPDWFHKSASLLQPLEAVNFAQAFWQFRFQAYNGAPPHAGYGIILDWIASKKARSGGFSFTSNIDGHWLRAGLDENHLYEAHGSISFTQCAGVPPPVNLDDGSADAIRALPQKHRKCAFDIWPADPAEWRMAIDPASDCAVGPFPTCRWCGSLSRPNVLMFDDGEFHDGRCDAQADRFEAWRKNLLKPAALADGSVAPLPKVVVIEIGAGSTIPTVRHQSESVLRHFGDRASLIRMNTEESYIPQSVRGGGREDLTNQGSDRLLSFSEPSLDALQQIDVAVRALQAETAAR